MNSPLKKHNGPRSVKLYWRVVRDMKLPLAVIGFLALLKTFAGSLGVIPAAEAIALAGDCDRKTVFKYISILRKAKLIKVVKRVIAGKQTSNCYLFEDESVAVALARKALLRGGKNGTRPLRPKKRDTSTSEQDTPPNIIPIRLEA